MKNINKITIMNICSTILLQGIAFFSAPIFTRLLGAEQYGYYSIFSSWSALLTCIMGFGVGSTLATGKYRFRDVYYEFRSSILLFGTLLSLIVSGIILLIIRPLSYVLGYEPWSIVLVLLSSISQYVIGFAQGVYVYEKEARKNFILSVVISILSVVWSVLLILSFSESKRYMGRIYGFLIPHILAAFFVWCTIFLKKPIGLRKRYIQFAFIVGFPTIFHTLAHSVLVQSDKVMMQYMGVSSSEIGIYSIYYTFVGVMSTILNALNTSWVPFYYDDVDAKNWEILNIKCKNYIELFTILTCGFLLLAREVAYLLAGREYWNGINIIPIIVLAVYFTFMYQFPVNFEFFHKKTKLIAMGTICAAIINIILNIIMIPLAGMYGAAVATALSYGLLFVFHYQIIRHIKEHPYHLKMNVFIFGLVMVFFSSIMFYFLAGYWYIRWIFGVIMGIFELRKIIKRKTIF